MKKIIILFFTILLSSCSSTKLNSYDSNFIKRKTQAEFVHLNIIKKETPETLEINKNFSTAITGEIINQIIKIPDYVGKIIKNNKKKYKQNYSARNSITFPITETNNNDIVTIKNLPIINLTRKVFIEDSLYTALNLRFNPINLKNGFMLFQFDSDKSKIKYTKAKTTKNYPFVDLRIEIKGFYIEKEDTSISENEITSKEIIIPFKNGMKFSDILTAKEKIYSSPFKIQNLMALEITVNETNPFYIKLEELETKSDENTEELTELIRRLIKNDDED
ncbi:hypothetical protein [uncultured Polaribacter sp.]|uniref:hypothetical protein n=1 Tax=uncultured Polaribacter sp. TaxID=174711 RepID=UPI00261A9757|nr:hypothetical protein [uncultured Polaribacter sp.]